MDRKRPREEPTRRIRRESDIDARPHKMIKRTHGILNSTLFQVPLEKRDIRAFTTPMNQHVQNPMNCGVVSTQLLGIIPKALSEKLSSINQPTSLDDWLTYMNVRASNPSYYKADVSLDVSHAISVIRGQLFEGFATLVGITRRGPSGEPSVGHFFVVATLRPGIFYLLDPQVQFSTDDSGLQQYIETQELNGDAVVIVTEHPLTPGQFRSDYINHFLPDLLTLECSIGRGGRKTNRKTRRRKTRRK